LCALQCACTGGKEKHMLICWFKFSQP